MELLGIGPTELLLIIILALVLVGPRDLAKFGRDAGRFLNKVYRSQAWRTMNEASREIRNLPTRLAREAELDTVRRDLEQAGKGLQESANAAAQSLEKDLKSAGEGTQARIPGPPPITRPAQPPQPPGPSADSPAPKDGPASPSDSPFAEG